MKASEQVEQFIRFMVESEAEMRQAALDEQECDHQTTDILHALEFMKFTQRSGIELSEILSQVRKKRRQAKETQVLLSPISDWLSKNGGAFKSMEGLLGDLRKKEEIPQKVYLPRTEIGERYFPRDSLHSFPQETKE